MLHLQHTIGQTYRSNYDRRIEEAPELTLEPVTKMVQLPRNYDNQFGKLKKDMNESRVGGRFSKSFQNSFTEDKSKLNTGSCYSLYAVSLNLSDSCM